MAETSEAITVLIVDDHVVVRQGLRTYLELQDGIDIVGEASNGVEAIKKTLKLEPDVVFMDLVMPELDGIAGARETGALSTKTKVIALTSFAVDDKIFPAIEAGAAGYLLKDVSPTDLVNAIRATHRGEAQLHPEVAKKLMDGFARRPSQPSLYDLTPRELDVLRLVGGGMSNREIAAQLSISQKTVKTHVSGILSKLGLADRTQAAIFAVRQGLVEG
jgi:NarL family two-component system response regulator LiaR